MLRIARRNKLEINVIHILTYFISILSLSYVPFLMLWFLGKLSEFVFSVGKMTVVSKGALSRQEMFAETDLIKLVRFGSWSFRDLGATILGGSLHLAESERKVCHEWKILSLSSDMLVSTKRSMNTEPL